MLLSHIGILRQTRPFFAWFVAVLSVGYAAQAQETDEPFAAIFKMSGPKVLVPVQIDGQEYQFAIDTGSSFSVLDIRLKHHWAKRRKLWRFLLSSAP